MAIDHTPMQQEPDLNKRRHLGEKRGIAKKVWRRLEGEQDETLDAPNSFCDRPLAPAGVHSHPEPAARSTNSTVRYTSNQSNVHTTFMEQHSSQQDQEQQAGQTSTEEQTQPRSGMDTFRKLRVQIPTDLLNTLRAKCAAKAAVSLLGRVQGKHPGLKTLTTWAKEALHPSLTMLSLKANNLFEVTFGSEEGRLHALRQADLKCETAAIFFASWRPHFDSRAPHAIDSLDCPVWVQVVDLCQVLREEGFLRTLGEQLGQVISIDTSEAYRAKLLGPRIRLLVQDVKNLPQRIVVPRLDGEGEVEYELEFSGLPNQCGRCRATDHQVRHCPKKDPERPRRAANHHQRGGRRGRAEQIPTDPFHDQPSTIEKGEGSTGTYDIGRKGRRTAATRWNTR